MYVGESARFVVSGFLRSSGSSRSGTPKMLHTVQTNRTLESFFAGGSLCHPSLRLLSSFGKENLTLRRESKTFTVEVREGGGDLKMERRRRGCRSEVNRLHF